MTKTKKKKTEVETINHEMVNVKVFKPGRPKKYNNVEEMEKSIILYFTTTNVKEWTVTGLALALGFSTRQSLINYEGNPEYLDTIKKAKLMVEHSYEIDLKEKGNTGTIFALKNFEWKDKTEVEEKSDKRISVKWEN